MLPTTAVLEKMLILYSMPRERFPVTQWHTNRCHPATDSLTGPARWPQTRPSRRDLVVRSDGGRPGDRPPRRARRALWARVAGSAGGTATRPSGPTSRWPLKRAVTRRRAQGRNSSHRPRLEWRPSSGRGRRERPGLPRITCSGRSREMRPPARPWSAIAPSPSGGTSRFTEPRFWYFIQGRNQPSMSGPFNTCIKHSQLLTPALGT